jgi:hypothetical protein
MVMVKSLIAVAAKDISASWHLAHRNRQPSVQLLLRQAILPKAKTFASALPTIFIPIIDGSVAALAALVSKPTLAVQGEVALR